MLLARQGQQGEETETLRLVSDTGAATSLLVVLMGL